MTQGVQVIDGIGQATAGARAAGTARALVASFSAGGRGAVPAGAVATGVECEAFRRWIDSLAAEGHEALLQLRECGFSYDLAALRAQLARAMQATPAGPGCRGVARRLLELLSRLQGAACFFLEEARAAG
jgi:hypothetical protein